jgi:phosphate transport system substrate-binding protein
MIRLVRLLAMMVILGLTSRADTNQVATVVRLNEKSIAELTAGLSQYENVAGLSGKLVSVGSGTGTTMVNHWAVEFCQLYPEAELDIRGGGATTNVFADFIAGKVDILPMSRTIPTNMVADFKARYGYEPTEVMVGPDALGFYVNKNNPVAGLNLEQLETIYSRTAPGGKIDFWGDVGVAGPLAHAPISRYCLSKRHGAHTLFRETVLKGAEYKFAVRFESIHSSLVQAVGADEAGIAFDSVMFATARTRFVPIQAEDGRYLIPSYDNVISGKYPLIRPIRIVLNKKPDAPLKPLVREFLRFAVSRRGQRINAMGGGFPMTAAQQQEALKVLGEGR